MGVFLYLTMDMAVQWGVIRHLRSKIKARIWLPALTIVLDLAILVPFAILKIQSDLFTVMVAAVVAAAIITAQVIAVRARSARES